MMGSLQKYFQYECVSACGLLSITLLGVNADWQSILSRLDKLDGYGCASQVYAALLRPIIRRFVQSFETPNSEDVINFWQDICVYHGGSGTSYYTGWITGFCFWDEQGKRVQKGFDSQEIVVLDRVKYGRVNTRAVPPAWIKAPGTLWEGPDKTEAEMVAGILGPQCSKNPRGELTENGTVETDSTQPSSGWWIYIKADCTEQLLVENGKDAVLNH